MPIRVKDGDDMSCVSISACFYQYGYRFESLKYPHALTSPERFLGLLPGIKDAWQKNGEAYEA